MPQQQPAQAQPAPAPGPQGATGSSNYGMPYGYNPLQPSYTNPTYARVPGLGAHQTIKDILAGFAPQAANSQNALNNTLAAGGIVGGGAQDATTLLQSNLAAALSPALAQAIQNSQGNRLQLGLANAGFGNQSSMFNANAANTARSQLASYLMSGWQSPLQAYTGISQSGLGGAAGLAGQEANNFPVYQQQTLLGMLGI